MINKTDILTAWQRIGWSETTASPYTGVLDTDNKTSNSGYLMDKLHPLCTFKNVKDTFNDQAVNATNINLHLKEWQQSSIVKVCNDVFSRKILESSKTFEDIEPTTSKILLFGTGKFVGYEIYVPAGFVMTIKSFGLLFDSVATKTIYVFNINKQANVTTKAATATTAYTELVTSWDYSIFGKSTSLTSGIYLVGYFQSSEQAVEVNFNYNHTVCRVTPVIGDTNGTSLPTNIAYSGHTYGLNLVYNVERDYTQVYLENPDIFDRAIGYSMVIKCLNQILFSEQMNTTIRKSLEQMSTLSSIFIELNGLEYTNTGQATINDGLKKIYLKEIDNIKNSLFPKKNITGTM
jgi:hypothetical protein